MATYTQIHVSGINLCDVGSTDCHTNATCLDRDGGYDCECNDGYTGNGTHCEGTVTFNLELFQLKIWQILMNAQMAIIHVMKMPPAPTLMVAMTVTVSLVSLGLASTAQVI